MRSFPFRPQDKFTLVTVSYSLTNATPRISSSVFAITNQHGYSEHFVLLRFDLPVLDE
jgi:hypothetical protein